jgi:hypothetical protein
MDVGLPIEALPCNQRLNPALFSSFFSGQTWRDDYNRPRSKPGSARHGHINPKGGIEK